MTTIAAPMNPEIEKKLSELQRSLDDLVVKGKKWRDGDQVG